MTRVSARRRDAVHATGRCLDNGCPPSNRVLATQCRARQVHFNDAHEHSRATRPASCRRNHSPPRHDRRSNVDPRGRCRSQGSGAESFHARKPRGILGHDRVHVPLSPAVITLKSAETRGASLDYDALATGGDSAAPSINPHSGVSWPRSIYRSREESGGGCPKRAARTSRTERARRRADGRTDDWAPTRVSDVITRAGKRRLKSPLGAARTICVARACAHPTFSLRTSRDDESNSPPSAQISFSLPVNNLYFFILNWHGIYDWRQNFTKSSLPFSNPC